MTNIEKYINESLSPLRAVFTTCQSLPVGWLPCYKVLPHDFIQMTILKNLWEIEECSNKMRRMLLNIHSLRNFCTWYIVSPSYGQWEGWRTSSKSSKAILVSNQCSDSSSRSSSYWSKVDLGTCNTNFNYIFTQLQLISMILNIITKLKGMNHFFFSMVCLHEDVLRKVEPGHRIAVLRMVEERSVHFTHIHRRFGLYGFQLIAKLNDLPATKVHSTFLQSKRSCIQFLDWTQLSGILHLSCIPFHGKRTSSRSSTRRLQRVLCFLGRYSTKCIHSRQVPVP